MIISRQTLLTGLFLISVIAIVSTWVICPDNYNFQTPRLSWYRQSSVTLNAATDMASNDNLDNERSPNDSINIAHLGNSIQYYNDMPRLLEHMMKVKFSSVKQNSCLRGGATIPSLWEKGNGMAKKFHTDPAKRKDGSFDVGAATVQDLIKENAWNFVVMNDHTQAPARPEKKQASIQALKEKYVPLLSQSNQNGNKDNKQSETIQQSTKTTVIFVQTAAYKTPVKDSGDLGTFDEFTEKLRKGYQEYARLVRQEGADHNIDAKVAPVGLAYQAIKREYGENNDKLWAKLYARDDFHPSPHGTLLETSVIYCTIVGEKPPTHDVTWWKTARYMQPPETEPLPLPTEEEASILRDVAWSICQEQTR